MPHLTQFLIFEATKACNLGHIHKACPTAHADRFAYVDAAKSLDDDTIVDIAVRFYREHGFAGMVGWHYYNEPTLEAERMFRNMERISAHVPEARYVLWTNGTRFPEDCSQYQAFDQIHITDYTGDGHTPKNIDKLNQDVPHKWQMHQWPLDNRLQMIGTPSPKPCHRMFTEFIIDHFGNAHLCCYDWMGLGSVGNVFSKPLADIVANWQRVRDSIGGRIMKTDAPDVCKTCTMRHAGVTRFVPEIAAKAQQYAKELETSRAKRPANPKIAVVFVSYLKVPEQRLRAHFAWNDSIYGSSNATVYVVVDREYDGLPQYVVQVIYPLEKLPVVDGKPRFSLTRTKNAGLESALGDGADLIVCTDVDMVFPRDCWQWMTGVLPGQAAVPVYVMAQSFESREDDQDGRLDHGCAGTVAMLADHWREVRWNERLCGYGADDGILRRDIRAAGIVEGRSRVVYHIAHDTSADQVNVPGKGRGDCYGRDDGFNFDNFEENRRTK